MKIVLLGGGKFLLEACRWLAKQIFVQEVVIVTSPRHAGELLETQGSSFEDTANEIIAECRHDKSAPIHFEIIQSLDEKAFFTAAENSELCFSFGAAWIFKRKHIDACRNLINMHCTSLPQWRGGGGYSWQILAGIDKFSITFHRIDEGVDTGNIIFSKVLFFPNGTTTPAERNRFVDHQAFIYFQKLISYYLDKEEFPCEREQDESFSSYFPRLNSSIHACINWDWSPSEIAKFISAFDDPYPGAFCYLSGSRQKVFLKKARVIEGECQFHPFQAGLIYRIDNYGIYICARGGALLVEQVFGGDGECSMSSLRAGDRLWTPREQLELAMSTRIIYTPSGEKQANN